MHREHDAVDAELGIERRLHLLDGLDELRQTFEREELALQRHQDRVGGGHRVDRQKIERRRAIDQHIGEVCEVRLAAIERRDGVAQAEGAVARLADLEFEAGKIECRRRDRQLRHRGRHDSVAHRRFGGEHVVGGEAAVAAIDAEAGRGVALRIEIDDQYLLADGGERGAEIDRGRGLADAALLVGDRQDAGDLGFLRADFGGERRGFDGGEGARIGRDRGCGDFGSVGRASALSGTASSDTGVPAERLPRRGFPYLWLCSR